MMSEKYKKKMSILAKKKGFGKWMKGKKHNEKTKKKMSKIHKGKTFSEETRRKISVAKMGHSVSKETRIKISKKLKKIVPRGKKSRLWKNGLTPEYNKARNSLEYRTWKDVIYKKYNWTCCMCGIKCISGNIVAHHLKDFATNISQRYKITNGIVLCRSCHKQIHGITK